MKVEASRLATAALPGQFLIVRADEQGERIPLTISDFDKEAGTVTIVTQNIGASTSEICSIVSAKVCVCSYEQIPQTLSER